MAGDCGSTCPAEGGFYPYDLNVGGNAVLIAAYAILAPVVFFTGFRFGTPGFSATLTTGILLEVLGFVGRILLHSTPDSQTYFTLSLVGTILGPTMMCAAIFLILPHILSLYGDHMCPFRPLFAMLAFYSLITVALVLEVVGIVYLAYEQGGMSRAKGADIIAGGLGLQTVALLGFCGLHFWFTVGLSSRRDTMDPKHSSVYSSIQFKRFIMGMEFSTLILIASSIYRIIELAGGTTGILFQNQVAFMVVNGALPLIACIVLTTFHPGAAFGTAWGPTSPRRPVRRAPPRPLQHPIGYVAHHRYDPFIRSQITPTSQKHMRTSSGPPELPSGSPGLPPNPKPTISPRMPPPTATGWTTPVTERRVSGPERRSIASTAPTAPTLPAAPRNLVDSDSLW